VLWAVTRYLDRSPKTALVSSCSDLREKARKGNDGPVQNVKKCDLTNLKEANVTNGDSNDAFTVADEK
jgi:hypothetical protein